jgi:hypothetical protein
MISLSGKAKVLEKLAIDNSPVLLTAVGVAGVIGTAVLTHRAATKAEIWRRNEIEKRNAEYVDENARPAATLIGEVRPISKKEHFQETWKLYIPPVISGSLTVGSIIMANRIGTKRAAALAAAYTISEKAYAEYREKVIEKMGEKEHDKIRNEIAQDRVRQMPPSEGNILMVSGGDHLFMEMYTGRYFRSDIETIRKAVNEVNYKINTHGYASISDFYDLIGLAHTAVSDTLGWTSDKLMDVNFDAVLSEDGQPCVAINFMTGPVRDYSRFH